MGNGRKKKVGKGACLQENSGHGQVDDDSRKLDKISDAEGMVNNSEGESDAN